LGLYGKNAFYTSETDDVFLVGEQKRVNGSKPKKEQGKPLVSGQATDVSKNGNASPKTEAIKGKFKYKPLFVLN